VTSTGSPVTGSRSAVVIVLAVLVGPLAIDRGRSLWNAIGGGTEVEVWEAAVEFRHAPNQLNPSPDGYGNRDVWSYLRSSTSAHDPTTYLPLPNFSGDTWNDPGLVNLYVGGWAEEPEGSLVLHPWSDGTLRRNAILAWTSPVSGGISIHGIVGRAQPSCAERTGEVLFSIDRGSTSLKTISLLLGQSVDFDYSTTIAAGESLYFVVDAGPDARCDLTYLGALHIFFPPDTDSTLTPI